MPETRRNIEEDVRLPLSCGETRHDDTATAIHIHNWLVPVEIQNRLANWNQLVVCDRAIVRPEQAAARWSVKKPLADIR